MWFFGTPPSPRPHPLRSQGPLGIQPYLLMYLDTMIGLSSPNLQYKSPQITRTNMTPLLFIIRRTQPLGCGTGTTQS